MNHPVKSLVVVTLCALATVLAADVAFGRIVSVPHAEYETVDGIRDYAHTDPDTLVLGSSYARSILPIAERLAAAQPPVHVAVVPIEGGKFVAYDWLLRHRLAPLIDERDARGELVRPNLERFMIVTNYWDMCDSKDPYPNLPARAWALPDYAQDVLANGVTSYNDNYLNQRVSELTGWSSLTRDRGIGRILRTLREKVRPKTDDEIRQSEAAQLAGWLDMVRANDMTNPALCPTREQAAALERMLTFAHEHKLDVTFVLWSMIPKSITEDTLRVAHNFRAYLERVAKAHGARVIDFQDGSPLRDSDFRKDLDHLEPWGDEKLTSWALKGPLSWMKTPPEHARR